MKEIKDLEVIVKNGPKMKFQNKFFPCKVKVGEIDFELIGFNKTGGIYAVNFDEAIFILHSNGINEDKKMIGDIIGEIEISSKRCSEILEEIKSNFKILEKALLENNIKSIIMKPFAA